MATDILIKCQGVENEYVAVPRASLPRDPYELIYLLKAEFATRGTWRDVAAAYFDAERLSAGITVLEQAVSDEVDAALKGTDDDCSRLDLLAALGGAYLMNADAIHNDAPRRAEELAKARAIFGRADRIDVDDPNIWVARGWGEFAECKTAPAREWLDNAHNKAFVLGSLGLAALLLNRPREKDGTAKTDATALLIGALRTNICPPSAWTALGHALFRDGRTQEAKDVARRALIAVTGGPPQERLEALYLIAVVESVERSSSGLEAMIAAIREAYVECGGDKDARILLMIADLHYNGGDYKSAAEFAEQAVARAQESPLASIGGMYAGVQKNTLVSALFQHGRALHHLNKFDDAIEAFDKLKVVLESAEGEFVTVNPGFYFRLGMLKLATGRKEDEDVAAQCLKKVIENTMERTFPAMRALGFLLGRRFLLNMRRGKPRSGDTFRKALDYLKQGLSDDTGKEDIPAQLVYAALTEEANPELALKTYEAVMAIAEEKKIDLDVEVWSNMASIMARMGRTEEAKKLMDEKVPKDDECPTVWYNKGRLAEILREEDEAVTNFKKISEGQPHFCEAKVRLGAIAANRGNSVEAEGLFKEAMNDPLTRPVAAAHLANLYGARSENKMAQNVLEQHRSDCDYLSLTFTKFIFKWLPPKSNDDRRWRFLCEHIGAPVLNVLKRNKHNAFASNAAGLFFAEVKEMYNAREAFTSAGSAAKSKSLAARINLAHLEVMKGREMMNNCTDNTGRINLSIVAGAKTQFEKAERLYDGVLKASEPQSSAEAFQEHIEVTHYLACAQFYAREFQKARKTFQKVLRHEPGSWHAWYNLSLTLYECAAYRVKEHSKDLAEMLAAKKEYQMAQRTMKMSSVVGTPDKSKDPVVGTKPEARAVGEWYQFIKQELKRHEVQIVNARNETEDRKKKEAERIAKLKAFEKEQEEKTKRELAEKEAENEKMQRAAAEAAARLVEYERQEEIEREKKRRKEQEMLDTDEDEEPKQSSAGGSSKKRKKSSKKVVVVDEEDDEEKAPAEKKAKTSQE